MAPVKFARALLDGRPIEVYGEGDMRPISLHRRNRAGTLARWTTAPFGPLPQRLYNLGKRRPRP